MNNNPRGENKHVHHRKAGRKPGPGANTSFLDVKRACNKFLQDRGLLKTAQELNNEFYNGRKTKKPTL